MTDYFVSVKKPKKQKKTEKPLNEMIAKLPDDVVKYLREFTDTVAMYYKGQVKKITTKYPLYAQWPLKEEAYEKLPLLIEILKQMYKPGKYYCRNGIVDMKGYGQGYDPTTEQLIPAIEGYKGTIPSLDFDQTHSVGECLNTTMVTVAFILAGFKYRVEPDEFYCYGYPSLTFLAHAIPRLKSAFTRIDYKQRVDYVKGIKRKYNQLSKESDNCQKKLLEYGFDREMNYLWEVKALDDNPRKRKILKVASKLETLEREMEREEEELEHLDNIRFFY